MFFFLRIRDNRCVPSGRSGSGSLGSWGIKGADESDFVTGGLA